MLIQNKIGNLLHHNSNGKSIDFLKLEWYEARKRIMRKQTESGREVSLKFLQENPGHKEGDILFEDENGIIALSILACDCIVISPKNMQEMASVCYEIGNKHLPLFYEKDQLLVPFENHLFQILSAQGYEVFQEERKLLTPLKTTVEAHESGNGGTLFSKIMKLKNADS